MESKGTFNTAGSSVDMTRSDEESMVDGPLISADALHSAIRREFHTVPTAWHAALLSLLHVVFVVLSVCVAALCVLKLGREDVCTSVLGPVQGDSVVVFGKVGLWLLVLLFTWCVQHHHSRARCRGYLRFYRQTQGLKHLPLTVHSAGNVMLLVVMAARLSPTVHAYMLLSILALELLVALPCLLYYTGQLFYNFFLLLTSSPSQPKKRLAMFLTHTDSLCHNCNETSMQGGGPHLICLYFKTILLKIAEVQHWYSCTLLTDTASEAEAY
ncbi:transmembrane protein 192 isoform X1 [Dunckerocampus dactyliophorus]|uniref:transmembrane protein 192 isoform X1 n=1 Tax=Dunckerocampus dactyliophorus TaxID=161453 RepID=UPI002406226B|nr:transmembrane protein 192 isoform X1 [Dunckerocampus dactyliophorus]